LLPVIALSVCRSPLSSTTPHRLKIRPITVVLLHCTTLPNFQLQRLSRLSRVSMHTAQHTHRARYCFTNSVRLSNADIASERLCMSSNFFHRQVGLSFQFSLTAYSYEILTGRGLLLGGHNNSQFRPKNANFFFFI